MILLEFISSLYSRPLNITLGIAGWLGIVWLIIVRKRLKMHWPMAFLLSSIIVVYAVYAVKFFALIEAGFDPAKSGGMSLYGVPFFIPILLMLGALITRRPIAEVFDVFSINTVLICMAGRANCFFYGCCQGIMITQNGYRLPTREIEMVFYFLLLVYLVPKVYRNESKGTAFPIYMVGYGTLRFILEFFRETNFDTIFHLAHLWSVLCVIIGFSVILSIREKVNSGKIKKGKR